MNDQAETLILSRADVARLLDLDRTIAAVEAAFRAHGEGAAPPPEILGVHVAGGGFHVKAGSLTLERQYFAAKTNANFMGNRERFGLPTIQGSIALHDAESGRLLALMDSIEISIQRTGAATAVAAKHLARQDSRTVAVAGCGAQGRAQLAALRRVLPIERAILWDIDPERAGALAAELRADQGLEVEVDTDYRSAARSADVCVTCTPSTEFLLDRGDVAPGAFVAGVGADNPEKRELSPELLAAGKLVVDVLEQCATIGDLHHAVNAGVLTTADVYAELGAVVAGRMPGRTGPGEITLFDSTGMALQDVAAAAAVYQAAVAAGAGLPVAMI